jgi:hypothetical protein
VPDRRFDDAPDAAHPRKDGCAPSWGENVDVGIAVRRPKPRNRRLGENRIADP